MDFDANVEDGRVDISSYFGTAEDVTKTINDDTVSESGVTQKIHTRFPKFNELPLEIRRMIWEESLPPVVPEVLVYKWQRFERWDDDLNEWEEHGIGPTVEVDFPAILHVCQESRSVALERAIVRKESRVDFWDEELWGDLLNSYVVDSDSGQSSGDEVDSSDVNDGRPDGEVDDFGNNIHAGKDGTGETSAEYGPPGDNAAASNPEDPVAAPQHTAGVSDEDDTLDQTTEDGASESEDMVSAYYVICRPFRPEMDYIFVDIHNLTPF